MAHLYSFQRHAFRSGFSLLCAGGALVFIAGCGGQSQTAGNSTNSSDNATSGNATTTSNSSAGGSSTLTIISPHPREIQVEFESLWKKQNPGIALKWLDQGGTSDDLKFVRDQFATNGKDKGIGVDLFFGGGAEPFSELDHDGLLQKLPSDYSVPASLNGVPLHSPDNTWVAAALSGFGILYNKQIATRDKLPVPQTWEDLGNPKLQDRIELADPRHSGSAHAIYEIILQTNGWDKGWKILTAMAGNAHTFATASSTPLLDVQNGEAVFCATIDFYASKAMAQAGAGKLDYLEPKGQYVVTPDPIALLPGATNSDAAKKFIQMVLSPEGQKLWYYTKGAPGGPQNNSLFRLPALPTVYKGAGKNAFTTFDPYAQKTTVPYDSDKATKRMDALNDLIGTVLVDNLDAVQAYWKKNPNVDASGYVPIGEDEFNKIALKWDDPTFADGEKQKWGDAARQKFGG